MIRSLFRRLPALPFLLLAAVLLLPAPASADPPDMQFRVESVGAATVRVFWDDVPGAQGYIVSREEVSMGTGNSISVSLPGETSEYLDTGLTPGVPYEYRFAALVNGHTYQCGGGTADVPAQAMPMDPPGGLSFSGHYAMDPVGDLYLDGELSWTPVTGASLYEAQGRTGDAGEYMTWGHADGDVTAASMDFPPVQMKYWVKIRALIYHFFPGGEESVLFCGPFSGELPIQVDPPNGTVWMTVDPGGLIRPAVTIPFLVTPASTPILRPQTSLTLVTSAPVGPANIFPVIPTPTPVVIR